MSLNEIKALTEKTRGLLEADNWTIEKLATATVRDLTKYAGIGKATAPRIISEAMGIVNETGAQDSERLAKELYYQNSPSWKILKDWEKEGMAIEDIAVASAGALAAVKGISMEQSLQLISEAQGIVNKRGLQSSRVVRGGGSIGAVPAISAAFDEEWLNGKVQPPEMSVRVKRNFEEAKQAYKEKYG
jgi:hypothetical protein